MISYFLLVMIPVVSIGYYAYTTSVQYVKEQTIQNATGTLKQARDNILEKMKVVERVDKQVYLDQSLQRALSKRVEPYDSFQITSNNVIPRLEAALNLTSNHIALDLFLHNDTLPEIFIGNTEQDPLSKGKKYELFHFARIEGLDWLRMFSALKTDSLWEQVDTDAEFGNVSLLRKMMDFHTVSPIGIMRITVKMDDLFENLNYGNSDTGVPSYLAVLNEQNALIYESIQNPLPKDWTTQPEHYLQIREPLEGLNGYVMALVPLHELEKGVDKVRSVTLLVCLLSLTIFLAIGAFISAYFTKHIRKIVQSLQSFQEGNFSKRIRFTGTDEFARIAGAFNEMAENIESLIEEVYVSNLRKKEAELEALQAQIKPHFLYNTLSSISRLGRLGEADKLHRMVSGLATFYRLTLNQGRSIIPIREEIRQVQSYIDIQKIKHVDRLDVSYDIHFSVLEYDTVKLILQPFVENALEHAMFEDRLHIRIVAYIEEGNIVFKVIDNGIGMSGVTVQSILASSGYGIRNVNERIKLQFGESFGVTLHSGLGIGTTVRIVIPVYKEESRQLYDA
jgi:two-component system sensor histidine kinase YesM